MNEYIVLFKTELDTLNLFSKQLQIGFEELGYQIFEFRLSESVSDMPFLYELINQGKVAAMIGFNSTFFGLRTPSGHSVWETLSVQCINILVDHPYWYHSMLENTPSSCIVLCIDRNHMDYVYRFYPHIMTTGFLPHGGTSSPTEILPISERKVDIFYAGSLLSPEEYGKIPDFSGLDFPADKICNLAIEKLKNNPDTTVEDAIETLLVANDINLSDEQLRTFISSSTIIERTVSSYYREQVLRTIADSDLSLTICGDGWSNCNWIHNNNVNYLGRISPEEVIDYMRSSKIVLNSMPWFKDGSHERIYNGMLSGALIVSDTNPYLDETIPQNAWYTYKLSSSSISNMVTDLISMMNDTESMQKIANSGYSHAIQNECWKNRAYTIYEELLK